MDFQLRLGEPGLGEQCGDRPGIRECRRLPSPGIGPSGGYRCPFDGGLAAQFALAQPDAFGGPVGDHVAELITIGTPFEGSWLLAAVQALRTGAQWVYPGQYLVAANAINSACAGAKSGICGLLNVLPSQVGTALELHSTAISDLPPWPQGLPVYDIAGDIQLRLGVGQLSAPLDIGDVAVLTDSATAHDTASDGKAFVANCGSETLSDLIAQGSPCYHVTLPSDPAVTQAVLTAIRARVNDELLPGWTPMKVASGPITSVSCTGQFCAAVGTEATPGNGYALTYSGGTWSKPTPLGTGDTYSVSCPSDTYCITGQRHRLRLRSSRRHMVRAHGHLPSRELSAISHRRRHRRLMRDPPHVRSSHRRRKRAHLERDCLVAGGNHRPAGDTAAPVPG